MTLKIIFETGRHIVKTILCLGLLLGISLIVSLLIGENFIASILSSLPNILGILLAGVLSSLAILFGLLSDADLSKIRVKNLERQKNSQKTKDTFLIFLTSVKNDTVIIFSSFIATFILNLCSNFDPIKISKITTIVLPINPQNLLLTFGLFFFFISISATHDIIISVFIMNEERYKSSNEISK